MLVYLISILISSGEYFTSDFSNTYPISQSSEIFLETPFNSILFVYSSPFLQLVMLDLNFNLVFQFNLQGNNSYTPVALIATDFIYILVNVMYLTNNIPQMIGAQMPQIGKYHELLIMLTYQGELIRTQ